MRAHSCCLPHSWIQPGQRSQTVWSLLWMKSPGSLPRSLVGCHQVWMRWYSGWASVFLPLSLKPAPASASIIPVGLLINNITGLPALMQCCKSDWQLYRFQWVECFGHSTRCCKSCSVLASHCRHHAFQMLRNATAHGGKLQYVLLQFVMSPSALTEGLDPRGSEQKVPCGSEEVVVAEGGC